MPAAYAAFDLLAIGGVDLRTQRWTVRRQRLEQIAGSWVPPMQLTPVTADLEEAREWSEVLPGAMGVEGLVVKHGETREVIVGGVLGPITHPNVVIAGAYDADGVLTVIGRTVPLKPEQSAQLAAVVKPAGRGHPWPDEISSQRWGGRDTKKPLVKVQPTVVAEVNADAATQAGQVRDGMRYVRLRSDLRPEDLRTVP